MVKIRLTRLGRHKLPIYRLVAIDSKTKRDGGYLQLLGTYNPSRKELNLKNDLILQYLKNGAQPSETALALLKQKGIWKSFCDSRKINTKKSKRKITKKRFENKKNNIKKEVVKKVTQEPTPQTPPA